MLDAKEDFQLIDVREEYEYEIYNINGFLIPLSTIPEKLDLISKEKKVVFHCKSGARSARAIEYLEGLGGFDRLYNLEGGILAWSNMADPMVEKYS